MFVQPVLQETHRRFIYIHVTSQLAGEQPDAEPRLPILHSQAAEQPCSSPSRPGSAAIWFCLTKKRGLTGPALGRPLLQGERCLSLMDRTGRGAVLDGGGGANYEVAMGADAGEMRRVPFDGDGKRSRWMDGLGDGGGSGVER